MRQPQDRNASCGKVGDDEAERTASLHPTSEVAPAAGLGMLHCQHSGSAQFAAEREALHQPHQDQQDRGGDADRVIARQQAEEQSRDTHRGKSEDKHRLSPDPVAQVSDDDPADRPHEERNGEGRQRDQNSDEAIEGGEEDFVEDQRGRCAIDKEVVGLERRADHAGHGSMSWLRFRHVYAPVLMRLTLPMPWAVQPTRCPWTWPGMPVAT
jgi:hypothetical protein